MGYKYHFYLAGPFFNAEQKAAMDSLRDALRGQGFSVADPRELGPVIVDTPMVERTPEFFAAIFDGNIEAMNASWSILAWVDEKDIGTAFELGFFYKRNMQWPGLTFTISLVEGAKTNVMLSNAVDHHFSSMYELYTFVQENKGGLMNFHNSLWRALKGNAARMETEE
jgi:nucleoside 2-deoxyribosyltransferase